MTAAAKLQAPRERPIIFSAPMVRALLDGRKTQTRRVVKNQAILLDGGGHPFTQRWDPEEQLNWRTDIACPHGRPGDLLWVRETWRLERRGKHAPLDYRADPGSPDMRAVNPAMLASRFAAGPDGPWRPSIHMPRWASRITLELTGVRVERLQDISEEDARAEAVELDSRPFVYGWTNYGQKEFETEMVEYFPTARESFMSLWESIHGPDSWAQNPWVWALSFRVLR